MLFIQNLQRRVEKQRKFEPFFDGRNKRFEKMWYFLHQQKQKWKKILTLMLEFVVKSQSRVVLSMEPDASRPLLSRTKAITHALWPVKVAKQLPVVTFHIFILKSQDPLTMSPLGSFNKAGTPEVWPVRLKRHIPWSLVMSQTLISFS